MKTILITGASGYIASHTIAELDPRAYRVIALDNYSNSSPDVYSALRELNPIEMHCYQADLRDKASLLPIFEKHPDIDGIIHFAALKSVPESMQNPSLYLENNVGGMRHLLDLAKQFSIQSIVFSSSCAVYGTQAEGRLDEDSTLGKAMSPYAFTKQIGEKLMENLAKQMPDAKLLSLRYFNPAGYHPSGLLGEYAPDGASSMIPILCRKVLNHEPFEVFGCDYPTRDGTCVRDFIHVSDIAKAHVKSLDYLFKQEQGILDHLNLGTGHGHSIYEVLRSFEQTLNTRVYYKQSERREGDVVDIYADNRKAKRLLGWEPQFSLGHIIQSAWQFWNKAIREKAA